MGKSGLQGEKVGIFPLMTPDSKHSHPNQIGTESLFGFETGGPLASLRKTR
ncbi:hypothetical protein SBA4_5390011 [Candidatus Sulfopaludibacter sp. SbA4]|nr:hypothetical protein SBA4_5390011 [Candidatus Sulfopaludibacter sp. SbA4]